jgi:hypothetical protein
VISGTPVSRKDTETLRDWFHLMLGKVENDESLSVKDKLKKRRILYEGAF